MQIKLNSTKSQQTILHIVSQKFGQTLWFTHCLSKVWPNFMVQSGEDILTLPETMRSLYKGDDLTKDQKHITHPTESYNICLTSILLTSSGIGLKAPAKPIT